MKSSPEDPVQRGRRQISLLWGGLATLLVLASPLGPWLAGRVGACPLKSLTGVPCPTCGTTRSALLLADFRFLEAFVTYPLPTLLWLGFLIGGWLAAALTVAGKPLPGWPRRLPWWATFGLVLGVGSAWYYSWVTGV